MNTFFQIPTMSNNISRVGRPPSPSKKSGNYKHSRYFEQRKGRQHKAKAIQEQQTDASTINTVQKLNNNIVLPSLVDDDPLFNLKNRLQYTNTVRCSLDDSSDNVGTSIISWKQLRAAMGTYYLWIFGRQPSKNWGGKKGIITSLNNQWNLYGINRRFVNKILLSVENSIQDKTTYLGDDLRKNNKGRPNMIKHGSIDEQIIAEWMEAGLGFRQTTAMVNQQRREEGRLVVGRSCVMLHFIKMQPKICKCTGSCSKWMACRLLHLQKKRRHRRQ